MLPAGAGGTGELPVQLCRRDRQRSGDLHIHGVSHFLSPIILSHERWLTQLASVVLPGEQRRPAQRTELLGSEFVQQAHHWVPFGDSSLADTANLLEWIVQEHFVQRLW